MTFASFACRWMRLSIEQRGSVHDNCKQIHFASVPDSLKTEMPLNSILIQSGGDNTGFNNAVLVEPCVRPPSTLFGRTAAVHASTELLSASFRPLDLAAALAKLERNTHTGCGDGTG